MKPRQAACDLDSTPRHCTCPEMLKYKEARQRPPTTTAMAAEAAAAAQHRHNHHMPALSKCNPVRYHIYVVLDEAVKHVASVSVGAPAVAVEHAKEAGEEERRTGLDENTEGLGGLWPREKHSRPGEPRNKRECTPLLVKRTSL